MSLFKLELSQVDNSRHLLTIGFGTLAGNDEIVKDVTSRLAAMDLGGAQLLLINGPASLIVACAITHKVSHLYGAVAVFDPKLAYKADDGSIQGVGCYVVSISHDPEFPVGKTLI